VSDIDTAVVDSLKALDPERPIREADIAAQLAKRLGNGGLGQGRFFPEIKMAPFPRPFLFSHYRGHDDGGA
jgi:hypothetical protein